MINLRRHFPFNCSKESCWYCTAMAWAHVLGLAVLVIVLVAISVIGLFGI